MAISLVLAFLSPPVNVAQRRHQSSSSTAVIMHSLPLLSSFVHRVQCRDEGPSFRRRFNYCVASFFFSTAIQP
ncbi:hypothetical protein L484_020121 [Morus notabilis]|uniref:Secreted protein n=1 Tax=Morus notabilis TaxID=981085 RepID=W9RBF9_9ROSA|nr:hypothetical protein L484_020121 [Morus notabilis]